MRIASRRLGWRTAAMAAVAAALALAAMLWLRPGPDNPDAMIAAQEAHRRALAGDLVIVDVRSPEEWRRTGVPEGALTVTIHHPGGLEGFAQAVADAVGGDRDTPLAVICAAGVRSSRAQAYLRAHGFDRARDISAGMLGRPGMPGWLDQDLPVEPCDC